MIAALGFERNPVAQPRGERLRPRPGADHGGVCGHLAPVGQDRTQPAALEPKSVGAGANQLAARAQDMLQQPLHQTKRVRSMPVFAHQNAALIIAR
jgi:hypothetical protein